jgi:sarcosine oxidase subunit gamma
MLERTSQSIRRRPIVAPAIESAAVTIRPHSPEASYKLRLPAGTLAAVPILAGYRLDQPINRFHAEGSRLSMRLGPDEWILKAPDADAELVEAEVREALGDRFHSLVDISHRHVGFEIAGREAANVLNTGCALDLHKRAFPIGMATRTLLGKAEVILARIDDRPGYRLECWRSYAEYVAAFLAESAREHLPP